MWRHRIAFRGGSRWRAGAVFEGASSTPRRGGGDGGRDAPRAMSFGKDDGARVLTARARATPRLSRHRLSRFSSLGLGLRPFFPHPSANKRRVRSIPSLMVLAVVSRLSWAGRRRRARRRSSSRSCTTCPTATATPRPRTVHFITVPETRRTRATRHSGWVRRAERR